MSDTHHYLKQQYLRTRFPRGAVEVWRGSWVLEPVEKPPNPAHRGRTHYSLKNLLKDERNVVQLDRTTHDLHHNPINPTHVEPPPEAWEFARWVGLEWRLENEND